jgi:hypothetical protein
MRRRIVAASLIVVAGILAACSDNSLPTAPVSGPSLKLTINANGCVDQRLALATIDPQIQGLITNLFKDQNQASSTLTMWENLKKDKLESRPLMNHIDNLTKWTLEHLSANSLNDPDGPTGLLNATTGSVKLLDLVFRCAGETPTQVPTPPAGFDALFKLLQPSATGTFTSSFNDAAAFIPADGELTESTLLVLVRQPDEVNVNTPFPKISRTVDVALAGGRPKELSVLFCPFETVDHERNERLVVAHQKTAVAPGAPVGEGVEYLSRNNGGTLECPHGIAFNPATEKNALKRGLFYAASMVGKAWSHVGVKTAYAGHGAIGGLISFSSGGESSLSPMVLVDPYVETGITDVAIPTTTYGDAINFSATLRVTGVPTTCGLATSPAVCSWVGQPVTSSLAGMPALTLDNVVVRATLDGQTQTDAIDGSGVAQFSFTHVNAGDNQTATLVSPDTINRPANAPHFAATTTTAPYTVDRRPLTVAAAANEWEYGTPETVTGTFTSGAVQYGENVTPSFTTTQNAMTEVGTYADALVADVVFGAGVRPENYIVTKTNAALTVVPAPLDISADDQSREYGLPNPTFSGSIDGIKNGDPITLTFATLANIASEVPPPGYDITPTAVGDRLNNYFIRNTHKGALTITPMPVSLVVGSPSRSYGDPNPSFTSSAFSTRNGDILAVNYSTPATALSAVGPYAVTATVTGDRVRNYAFTITPGTLSITPRVITVIANNASRNEGAANPIFTGVVGGAGLASGDGVGVSYSTDATTESAPGSYLIVPGLTGAGATNYDATLTNGSLTVAAIGGTPSITSLTLTSSSISIANSSTDFTAVINNPGGSSEGWNLQGTLIQGTASQASGGVLPSCGAGSGVLPSGNCTQSFSINPTISGVPTPFTTGAATFQLQLKHNDVVIETKTVTVTLVP